MLPIQTTTFTSSLLGQPKASTTNIGQVMYSLYQAAAAANKTPQQIFRHLFVGVIQNFDTLNQQGNSAHMPEALQEAIVLLIMSTKDENDSSISQPDIITTLDMLESNSADQVKEAIAAYRKNGVESFLTDGVVLYNANTHKNIILNDMNNLFEVLPLDIYCHVNQFVSSKNHSSLFLTSKYYHATFNSLFWQHKLKNESAEVQQLSEQGMTAQYIFNHYPEHREDRFVPCDKRGLAYLKNIGINGPFMKQKIESGEWSIAKALEIREENLIKLNAATNELGIKSLLDIHVCRKYIIDGSLTIDDVLEGEDDFLVLALSQPIFQKFLDEGLLTMDEVKKINDREILNLRSETLMAYIDEDLLPIDEVRKLTRSQLYNLKLPVLKKYVDAKWLTIDEVKELTPKENASLSFHMVKKYVDIRLLTINEAKGLTYEEHCRLTSPMVQRYLDNGLLTMDEVKILSIQELIKLGHSRDLARSKSSFWTKLLG